MMRYDKQNQTDELMDALNGVRKEYLEEADHLRRNGKKVQGRKRLAVLLAAAAVFVAAIGTAAVLIIRNYTRGGNPAALGNTSEPQESGTEDAETSESADPSSASVEPSPDEPETVSGLPLYHYTGGDPAIAAVMDFLMTDYRENVEDPGDLNKPNIVELPACCILKTEEMDSGRLKVVGTCWIFTYRLAETTLFTVRGGETPGPFRIILSGNNAENTWEIESFERPGHDRIGYKDGIILFAEGDEELETLLSGSGGIETPHIKEARIQTMQQYIAENGLDISAFQDQNKDPVMIPDTSDLPLYHYTGDDPVKAAVTEYVMDYYRNTYEKEMLATGEYSENSLVVSLPAFCFHKTKEQEDGRIKVYASFWGFTYRLEDRNLVTLFGGEYPGAGVVTLRKSDDSDEWIVEEFERNDGLGTYYIDDILRFSEGDEELKEMYLCNDSAKDPIWSARLQTLREYIRKNNLPIDSFQDYGWDPVMIPDYSRISGTYTINFSFELEKEYSGIAPYRDLTSEEFDERQAGTTNPLPDYEIYKGDQLVFELRFTSPGSAIGPGLPTMYEQQREQSRRYGTLQEEGSTELYEYFFNQRTDAEHQDQTLYVYVAVFKDLEGPGFSAGSYVSREEAEKCFKSMTVWITDQPEEETSTNLDEKAAASESAAPAENETDSHTVPALPEIASRIRTSLWPALEGFTREELWAAWGEPYSSIGAERDSGISDIWHLDEGPGLLAVEVTYDRKGNVISGYTYRVTAESMEY